MPPDSPPAAPSQLATALAQIAWCDLNRVELDEVPALAIAFDEKLAPVREAMANARQGLDMISVFSAFPTGAVRKQVDAVLLSLSPQPPEAQT